MITAERNFHEFRLDCKTPESVKEAILARTGNEELAEKTELDAKILLKIKSLGNTQSI